MTILYIWLTLITFWLIVWGVRIIKAILQTTNYILLIKLFILFVIIWSIINSIDYLITN